MKYLEQVRVVQFFLFEQQNVPLGEITGIFGPNGSGKSSLLDPVQIAMLGANGRLVALNAQADEQATTRSLRAYCLGQYGESPEHRARDNATTYITLVWRDTEAGAPLSMGVCLYASADRDGHEERDFEDGSAHSSAPVRNDQIVRRSSCKRYAKAMYRNPCAASKTLSIWMPCVRATA